ncbi:hypothetical protein [Novibacillus thermophilus]|uniref:Hydrolase n=1 Tax=Novibacillus thermophilus TaxID=1471761 RepID=A0A1U9K6F9_9BACL|nr:hypothetical protein [Novibacillus thermophilus]AQS55618.1 hypothetical protein B0W44_07320 [Novibacillus thermophilus]
MKAILFDLDGTLLPMDTDAFLHQYLKALAAHVKHIFDPDLLVKHVTDSTKAVIGQRKSRAYKRIGVLHGFPPMAVNWLFRSFPHSL